MQYADKCVDNLVSSGLLDFDILDLSGKHCVPVESNCDPNT